MKNDKTTKTILFFSTLLIAGLFAMQAMAFRGGPHHRGTEPGEYGPHGGQGKQMGYRCDRSGPGWNDLSAEEIKALQTKREQFFAATQKIRTQYHEARQALNYEYAKIEADTDKIRDLKKQLIDLRAELDKKRLDYLPGLSQKNGHPKRKFGRGYGGCY